MEFHDVVEKRRTIRDFAKEEVPFDIIQKALHLGLKAPSYNHLKQWDFILVNDISKRIQLVEAEKLKEVSIEELKEAFNSVDKLAKEMYVDAIPKQKKMILEAPELLVVVYTPKTQVKDSQKVYDLNCLASVWCCIENILLSLAEDNVFGVTFIPQYTALVKKILEVPAQMEIAAFIPFGYKTDNAKILPQKEISLSDRLHKNKW